MRISGYGGGASGRDASGRDRDQRREAFRRAFRVGDRVRGVFKRREGPGLGWVRIEGHELLAEVGDEAQPGQALHFLVRELAPEIVLQALSEADAQGLGGLSLSDLVRAFLQARDALETRLKPQTVRLSATPREARKSAYLAYLAADKDALAGWLRLSGLLLRMNEAFAARGAGSLFYLPWLFPHASGFELLCRRQAAPESPELVAATLGFSTPRLGRCECRFLCRGAQTSFRVGVEFPARSAPFVQDFSDRLARAFSQTLPAQALCLGVGPLTHSGATLLAPFLDRSGRGSALSFRTSYV